ncbi:ATP-binding cassette domain-containing protein [Microbacterium sp. KSW4-11]|uniref:ATP-binding cassette domain-containing protein n=1 Tax=Microbacterium gawkjiense TaxID=3067309 RepID=A0ABU3GEA9_9MICO|nr:ATP-binding cassette domain-containing protein [Microbacterium sp. KSW4-11]MDT3317372.1 ATP-binding cassette domain-containing protein [Microbacterium sp. KSW4-11]
MSGADNPVPPPPPAPVDEVAQALPPKPEVPAAVAAARFEEASRDPGEAPADQDDATSEPVSEQEVLPEAEPELEAQSESEADGEPEVEPAAPAETEPVAASGPEPEVGAETEPETELAAGVEIEPEAGVETEPETELAAGVETEPEIEPEPAMEPEAEPEVGPAPETEPAPAAEIMTDDAPSTDAAALETATAVLDLDGAEAGADASDPAPALRLEKVSKSFGRTRAVDAVDLEIPAGTFYGLVGPNGAGKTTTLSMIAGLLRPDAGTIVVGGVDLQRDPRAAKALMGVLPDRLRTFDRLTGRQLLHYYGVLRGLRPAVVAERTEDLARAFDLTAALVRPVSDYSAGMTKKIMLAGAMIHAPRLLVLDEPFEAVDPVSSEVILEILTAYVARGGTVILSSHGMELVERVCDGVAVIVAGQVLAHGSVDEVRGDHTLAERFVQLSGGLSDVEGLEWLHTYSD